MSEASSGVTAKFVGPVVDKAIDQASAAFDSVFAILGHTEDAAVETVEQFTGIADRSVDATLAEMAVLKNRLVTLAKNYADAVVAALP